LKPVVEASVLLIVEDDDSVRTALRRFFELYFVEVLTADSPTEAEAQLQSGRPGLLLCDYYLGARSPLATALIPRWRKAFPFLSRVAIMTGTSHDLDDAHGAEAVFSKPLNMQRVLRFLRGETD
jgi:DNA-binding NtrC family response regulator